MARPAFVTKPVRKNYYLPKGVVEDAAKLARQRYGISTSELIRRLLIKEIRHPKGVCHAHPQL